ncbi:FliM/FliN family flagellar motor C-terminal domain-containing protein [Pseudophaeobacter sp.]|uniref:FliM/FliN family flagellar motor C-terminal domain-containing protein n=1 Tax=Pseudophaeobacter sp. TaxID=1971739 RepID=UPI0032972319
MSEAEKLQAESGGSGGGLARKLAASKDGPSGQSGSFTLKALRRSLARAASEQCDLPLAVLAARQSNRTPEDLPDQLSDKDLLVVLDGPNGRMGAASLDAALVTALIQKQTIGQIMGKAPSERNYTPTDAAMMAEFLEKSFSKIYDLLEGQPDQLIFSGYRYGAQVEDVRSLVLGLEGENYRMITLNVDLAIGAMQGVLKLILPEPTPEELGLSGGAVGPSLASGMGAMRAELSAILCKVRVPLNEFSALKVGEVLPLDQAFLYETDLIGIEGKSIATGRLGQLNGARAVRLNIGQKDQPPALPDASDGFADSIAGDAMPSLPPMEEPAGLSLGIADQDLQDPLDDGMGFDAPAGGLDMGGMGGMGGDLDPSGLNDDMSDLGAGLGDLGGGMGGDLGGGLGGDLGGNLGGDLGADLGMGAAPMGDFPGLDDGMAAFNPDDAAAEISKLAGLEGDPA